jgi:hypothetical protein
VFRLYHATASVAASNWKVKQPFTTEDLDAILSSGCSPVICVRALEVHARTPDLTEEERAEGYTRAFGELARCWHGSADLDPTVLRHLMQETSRLNFAFHYVDPDAVLDQLTVLKEDHTIAPWLREAVLGRLYFKMGVRARGTDWAYEVSDTGWERMGACHNAAHDHLVRAYRLNPDLPEPASTLVEVAMFSGASRDERYWMDQALAAEMDCPLAIQVYAWALMPRWGGSVDELVDLAVECMHAGRVETHLPAEFVRAVQRAAEEAGDWRSVYRRPEVYQTARSFFDDWIALSETDPQTQYRRTLYLSFAWAAGDYETAVAQLDGIHRLRHTWEGLGILGEFVDPELLTCELEVRRGTFGEDLRQAVAALDHGGTAGDVEVLLGGIHEYGNREGSLMPALLMEILSDRGLRPPYDVAAAIAEFLAHAGRYERLRYALFEHNRQYGRTALPPEVAAIVEQAIGDAGMAIADALCNPGPNRWLMDEAELTLTQEELDKVWSRPGLNLGSPTAATERVLALARLRLLSDRVTRGGRYRGVPQVVNTDVVATPLFGRGMDFVRENSLARGGMVTGVRCGLGTHYTWQLLMRDKTYSHREFLEQLAAVSDPELVLERARAEFERIGGFTFALKLANLLRDKGLDREGFWFERRSLDYLNAVRGAPRRSDLAWLSSVFGHLLISVPGYEERALKVATQAMDAGECGKETYTVKCEALFRLGRYGEALDAIVAAADAPGGVSHINFIRLNGVEYTNADDYYRSLIHERLLQLNPPPEGAQARLETAFPAYFLDADAR